MRVNTRLRRWSRTLRTLCLGLALLVPVLMILPWIYPGYFGDAWGSFAAFPREREALSWGQSGVGIALSLVPAGLTAFALARLAVIFREFASDRAFSDAAVRAFRTFAALMCLVALTTPLVDAAQGVVISWSNGPGERVLALTFRARELQDILFAFLLLALAQIFRHGHVLADEQAHIL